VTEKHTDGTRIVQSSPKTEDQLKKCPLCGSKATQYGKSRFHNVDTVAGVNSSTYIDKSYILYKCISCKLVYKLPLPTENSLRRLYGKSGKEEFCEAAFQQRVARRFDEIETIAFSLSKGKKVLDIGCGNGAMLKSWDDCWDKFGVEYSLPSSRAAMNQGIKIIGRTLSDVSTKYKSYFDIVTLIDVVEHIPNPKYFFRDLLAIIRKQGIIIILTGTTDYWFWRFIKSGYWYESFPEHLVFFSKKTFQFMVNQNSGKIVFEKRVTHTKIEEKKRMYLLQFIKNLFYLALQSEYGYFVIDSHKLKRGYPSFTAAKDHVIIAIQKI
jgi:2-polyprenyl-3-methyl-5-hydroxy-6-metoxy-1,4-benzoquinol methylase